MSKHWVDVTEQCEPFPWHIPLNASLHTAWYLSEAGVTVSLTNGYRLRKVELQDKGGRDELTYIRWAFIVERRETP